MSLSIRPDLLHPLDGNSHIRISKVPACVILKRMKHSDPVILCIVPAGYPYIGLTPQQQKTIKEALLEKILDNVYLNCKPKFAYCKSKLDYLLLSCKNHATAEWVKIAVSALVPLTNAQLYVLEAHKILHKEVLYVEFVDECDDDDRIRGFLEKQNENLSTSAWIIRRKESNGKVLCGVRSARGSKAIVVLQIWKCSCPKESSNP